MCACIKAKRPSCPEVIAILTIPHEWISNYDMGIRVADAVYLEVTDENVLSKVMNTMINVHVSAEFYESKSPMLRKPMELDDGQRWAADCCKLLSLRLISTKALNNGSFLFWVHMGFLKEWAPRDFKIEKFVEARRGQRYRHCLSYSDSHPGLLVIHTQGCCKENWRQVDRLAAVVSSKSQVLSSQV
ncbi:hypothetical protein GH714_021353 [Hevea brasiliensis]|uniref:Uncharacterized protein n=1 Tax=Hevea brasiliensis TaxID=3981 RepID=A0A6A6LQI7_HEVBR|nr:hypothetical protein GH714_021353 [Hevea brasiliensis]